MRQEARRGRDSDSVGVADRVCCHEVSEAVDVMIDLTSHGTAHQEEANLPHDSHQYADCKTQAMPTPNMCGQNQSLGEIATKAC